MASPFDPHHPLLKSDPYALFQQYRVNGPVQRGNSTMPGYEYTWYFFGFEEARLLLKSSMHEPLHRVEKQDGIGLTADRALIWQHLSEWPLFQSPPMHTERRALTANAFRGPALQKLASSIQTNADRLLDKALHGDSTEIQRNFSYPLAVTAITSVLGMPPPDIAWFKRITKKIADVLDLGYVPDAYGPGIEALNDLIAYAQDAVAWKRDHLADDLLSQLLVPLQGAPVDEYVVVSLITQMLVAGQETVADSIGNGVNLLATHPDQLSLLRQNPQLMHNAIQEILRFDCPVQFTSSRILTADMRFNDIHIAAGEVTIVALGACNRDARRFADPEYFNIQRDLSGYELSFGHGIHYCLGVHFARMVMHLAFQQLLSRLPDNWRLAAPPVWRENTIFRGPAALTLSL